MGSAPFLQSGDDGWVWSQELIPWRLTDGLPFVRAV